ncbi:IS630 family transposase [Candidatus Fermentibacteria bacterium]|nr:MAG: IS630 family transposase [Candidatus Fermentibacteria bacterium]
MARKSNRADLRLTEEQRGKLLKISQSRTAPVREVQRAQILLRYSEGEPISSISKELHTSRPTIYKCIDKALAAGIETGLKDKYHRAHPPVITDAAKAWVVNLACTKPTDHGYAAETWSLSQLAKHTKLYAPAAGHKCLNQAAKSTIQRILKSHPVQPHKIRYYLERRDPDFKRKMEEVLIVYKEVNAINDSSDDDNKIITVSVDEKPGIQAIGNVAPDRQPIAGTYPRPARDYEYKRFGTLSLLAALDLHTGHIFGQVHERHRSREFVMLLKELDEYYPADCTIRIILDNHSSHISKETMAYLQSRPNRFIYVHTPKHGSWLNLVETYFSKIARTFLKHIRVNSKEELKERILQGIRETNAEPVVHRWRNFDFAQEHM